MNINLSDIIEFLRQKEIDCSVEGETEGSITGFASIKEYRPGCITWLKSDQISYDSAQNITLCVVKKGVPVQAKTKIITEEPKRVFFEILENFFGKKEKAVICSDSIVETEKIGRNVSIGHHCFIGPDVIIEDNVTIRNHVQIECPATIGEGTRIASGVVIGTDGFGYYRDENGIYQNVPHFGGVTIGRDVVIGANTCIDRGTMENTFIGDHVKIDNLCHIAHNVRIEENSLVIALSMLGGSSVIRKNGYIAPGVMIKNQITVGENSLVGMGAVALENVPDNQVVIGVPAECLRQRNEEE